MSLQPTIHRPGDVAEGSELIPTYALVPGERVLTRSGPRTVVAVELGVAGGWRSVTFTDGAASVTYTQPWVLYRACWWDGCEGNALEGGDYCGPHNAGCGASARLKGGAVACDLDYGHDGRHRQHRAGELVAEWR